MKNPAPTAATESIVALKFPVAGLDISESYSGQRPGTTAVGQNVRAYDAMEHRERGGSRPGLEKWIPPPVAAVDVAVQDLDVLTMTILPGGGFGSVPPPTSSGGPVRIIGSGGGAGDQTGTSDGGGRIPPGSLIDDPSDGGRGLLGDGSTRQIPIGGSGFHTGTDNGGLPLVSGLSGLLSGTRCSFQLRQWTAVSSPPTVDPINLKIPLKPVKAGNLIFLYVAMPYHVVNGDPGDAEVDDSRGTIYAQSGGQELQVFQGVASESGDCTVSVTTPYGCKVFVCEIHFSAALTLGGLITPSTSGPVLWTENGNSTHFSLPAGVGPGAHGDIGGGVNGKGWTLAGACASGGFPLDAPGAPAALPKDTVDLDCLNLPVLFKSVDLTDVPVAMVVAAGAVTQDDDVDFTAVQASQPERLGGIRMPQSELDAFSCRA